MSKLSKSALSEVGYQLCIICLQPYSSDHDCKLLPCGHHYCARCVAQEVERLLGQQEQITRDHDDEEDVKETIFYSSAGRTPSSGRKTKQRFHLPPKVALAEPRPPTLTCPICGAMVDAQQLIND